jgi:GWxTD domain-containing protein
MKPVRQENAWKVLYELDIRDTTNIKSLRIEWQNRDGLNEKEPKEKGTTFENRTEMILPRGIRGNLTIPAEQAPKIVVARVINARLKRAWLFYSVLEPNYPTTSFIFSDKAEIDQYVSTTDPVSPGTEGTWIVSYYNDTFPAAAPAFSEALAKVPRTMETDSVFHIKQGDSVTFFKKGLYLLQQDTLKAEGVAVRAENDYPRYARVENLAGPFIYICTKQEYDKLEIAKADKKTFDKTVLSITGDPSRARTLIKNYFRRVELANFYFTSYKEGWKTDRGMIYVIFGVPDEVFRFYDREVWNYRDELYDASFEFTKASSVFDPDNYVLIRDKKYKDTWYEVIDLWRNARF